MDNMGFSLTTEQVRDQTKTVTRRMGWLRAHPGDVFQPVVKRQGLRKGEHPEKIGCPIRVVHAWREPLSRITQMEVTREGFPAWSVEEFLAFYCRTHKCRRSTWCTRIEFQYTIPKEKV